MTAASPGNAHRAGDQPAQSRNDPVGKRNAQAGSQNPNDNKLQHHRPPDLPAGISHSPQCPDVAHLGIDMVGDPELHHDQGNQDH